MGIVFKNNAKTTLASSLSNSATSATVTDGSVFPSLSAGEFFLITFDDGSNNEICKCTARSGNTLTIVRAQESTTARAFSSGDAAEGRVTAGVLETIQENIAAKSANQTVFNATTAGGATTYNIGTNPGVEANAMVFLNGVLQHHDTISFSGTNLTFDAAPPNGMALEVIIDNLINLQSSNLTVDSFTAADVSGNPQTDFTLSDTPAAETNLIVFVDGVFQDQDAYTISSNTLTITTGVIAGRGVTVYVINPVNIGTPSDSTVTSAKLSGNITMPGTLTVGSNDVAFDSPTFVVDHTNSRVGLGTASPSVPVDIVGDVKMSANLTVDTSTLIVDSTNNCVGIGITPVPGQSGSTTLHINSSNAASYLRLTNSATGSATTDGFDILNVGAEAYVWNREDGNIRFGVDNTEKMRLTDDGEIQLGTSIGNSTYAGQLNSVANLGTSGANIQTRNGTGNKHYILRGDNNVEYGFLGLDSQSGAANLLVGSADNQSIRMQSGGMQIELTDGVNGDSTTDTGTLSITNTDISGGGQVYSIRSGRYLTSNGTGWGTADGKNPALVIANDTSTTGDRSQPGIILHNENNTDDAYGPFIGWGSKSASGSFNTGYAWIMGSPTGNGPDTNWKAGQLELYTQSTAYVADKPGIRITSAGLVQKPRQYDANGFFWARSTSNPSGQSGTTGVVFTTRAQAGSGNFSTTTGRYTTPVEGIYHFSTQVRIDALSDSNAYMRLAFYTGTSPSVTQESYGQGHVIYGPGSYSTNYYSMVSSWSVHLAANVQVGVAVFSDQGTYTIHQESNFSGHLVG